MTHITSVIELEAHEAERFAAGALGADPALTIMALASRLADRMEAKRA